MRAAAHYIFSIAVLSIYGGEVCPYIATLDIVVWTIMLAITFGAAYFLREILVKRIVDAADYQNQVKRQFALEFSLFIAASLLLSVYNMMLYDFPIASAAKVLLGCVTLGFFVAADLALERERKVTDSIVASGGEVNLNEKFFPLTAKFAIVASFSVALFVIIVFMVISRDLIWLGSIDQESLLQPRLAVLVELVFIGTIMLAEIINLIFSYSKNMKLFFSNENSTLAAVAGGNLGSRVPVSSNDEFGFMAKYTNQMIESLKVRTEELQITRDVTIMGLATLAETRDNETGAHILRTQRYVKALAEQLADKPRYRELLDEETIELLYKSAPLHDIGKVGVKDSILLKPGKLSVEEFEEMKLHPVYGRDALQKAGKDMGSSSFLLLAGEIAYTHHEKWDGSGYPEGLKGDDIPLAGRLMALADVYDALISKRVYKAAFAHTQASEIILNGRGSHFDPGVVDAFLAVENKFIEIAREYADAPVAEVAT